MMFYCMFISYIIYSIFVDSHCYFQLFPIMTYAATNIGIKVLNQVLIFNYFEYILRSGLSSYMVILHLIF